jgi:hypothetical protein
MASMGFNPFARHTESQPEPVQVQPIAETKPVQAQPVTETAVDQPADSKPVDKPSPTNPFRVEPKDRPKPERTRKPPPAQELLIWIQQCWNKPTISLRDIQIYGPRAIRDRSTAVRHAETLEKYGWLAPVRPRRRDQRVWRLPPAGATVIPD